MTVFIRPWPPTLTNSVTGVNELTFVDSANPLDMYKIQLVHVAAAGDNSPELRFTASNDGGATWGTSVTMRGADYGDEILAVLTCLRITGSTYGSNTLEMNGANGPEIKSSGTVVRQFDQNRRDLWHASITTTDATPTTIATIPVATDENVGIDVRVNMGRKVSSHQTAGNYYSMTVGAWADSAGTVTVEGQPLIEIENAGETGATISAVASGTDVLIQVTGIAAEDIVWGCHTTDYRLTIS